MNYEIQEEKFNQIQPFVLFVPAVLAVFLFFDPALEPSPGPLGTLFVIVVFLNGQDLILWFEPPQTEQLTKNFLLRFLGSVAALFLHFFSLPIFFLHNWGINQWPFTTLPCMLIRNETKHN